MTSLGFVHWDVAARNVMYAEKASKLTNLGLYKVLLRSVVTLTFAVGN
jgi:hypothetical protein